MTKNVKWSSGLVESLGHSVTGSLDHSSVARHVEVEVKYAGYIERSLNDIQKFRELESIRIPEQVDFCRVPGLSNEVREKLGKARPANLAQAERISGVTPAAVLALMVYLKPKR